MEFQEIETKIMSLLEIKRIRQGLTDEESVVFQKLNKKYRDEYGKLKDGSFFVNSQSLWEKVN